MAMTYSTLVNDQAMSDSREQFGLWLSDFVNKHGYPPDIDEAWQAAERQAFERAIKALETVRAPICDPARPIRELIEQSASKEKQHG